MRIFQINTFALVLAFMASSVVAQGSVPVIPAEAQSGKGKLLHPWQAAQSGQGGDAYFVNLGNGDKIETPFLVKFGLSGGWGLAPISKASSGKSGHHHLLVNRDLPLDFKQALPFTEQYIHFGKGQMETVLNLAPGDYTLRLLLADQMHLPHFVYSKPLKITVTKKNSLDPASLSKKGISLNVVGDELKRPFRVQFHASGLSVAHLAQQEAGTGHFRLSIAPKSGAKPVEMNFFNGQTETWLEPPVGDYVLRLDFVDNVNPGQILARAEPRSVRVN
ncbi:MAG: DUF4399 domain-containing protein [Rhodoferax sp.]|nr:DUF4399 domain-containing protein [Rhodoferax sp.]